MLDTPEVVPRSEMSCICSVLLQPSAATSCFHSSHVNKATAAVAVTEAIVKMVNSLSQPYVSSTQPPRPGSRSQAGEQGYDQARAGLGYAAVTATNTNTRTASAVARGKPRAFGQGGLEMPLW